MPLRQHKGEHCYGGKGQTPVLRFGRIPFVLSLEFVKGHQAPAVRFKTVPNAPVPMLCKSNIVL